MHVVVWYNGYGKGEGLGAVDVSSLLSPMAAIGEGSQTCDAHELDAPRRVNGVVDLLEEFHAGQTPDEVELALPDACLSNGTSSVAEGRSCAAAEQRGGAEGASLVIRQGPVQGAVGEASASLCT